MASEVADIGHPNYYERLKKLHLFSFYGRLLRADIIKYWKIFHGEVDAGLPCIFTVAIDRQEVRKTLLMYEQFKHETRYQGMP